MIRFRCNHCSLAVTAEDDRAGKKFQCPRCGRDGVIPNVGHVSNVPTTQRHVGNVPHEMPRVAGAKRSGAPDERVPGASLRSAASHPAAPPEEIEPVRFSGKRPEDEGLDMTPMVDVTFLLLIFFMVTAAFSLQKSIEVPAPDQQESSTQARTIEEIEQDDDYLIIRIGKDNTVWVNEREATGEQDVLVKLREAREGTPGTSTRGPTSLLVLADRDARHETVVMCLDAANDRTVGMENVRLACVDEEDL